MNNLHELWSFCIQQIEGEWFILGRGHYYNPEGFVYFWPAGVWSSMPPPRNCYETRDAAENKLLEFGFKKGIIWME